MLQCGTPVESCLHLCLKEHLNAEITLGTITDISVAVEWLRTTFLFVRALKQPDKYGIRLPPRLNDQTKLRLEVEQYLFGNTFRIFFSSIEFLFGTLRSLPE